MNSLPDYLVLPHNRYFVFDGDRLMLAKPASPRAALLAFLLILSSFCPIHAAITTTGNVSPNPSTTTSGDDLHVGSYVPSLDGAMVIDTGSDVESKAGYLGSGSSTGTVRVDGTDSTWTNSSDLLIIRGDLTITSGGLVTNKKGFVTVTLGSTSASVTVDGPGSTWSNDGDLSIAQTADGALLLTRGGRK